MSSGLACLGCHQSGQARVLVAAGTVYSSPHEADNCRGVNSQSDPLEVSLTDAHGTTATLSVNRAGNFFTTEPLVPPLQVELKRDTQTRRMLTPAPSGNCNGCHTSAGTRGAPGRILAP
jgi:hypothetical protein